VRVLRIWHGLLLVSLSACESMCGVPSTVTDDNGSESSGDPCVEPDADSTLCDGGKGPPERHVRKIAAGSFHTCVWFDDKQMYCWGENDKGQFGAGGMAPTEVSTPIKVTDTEGGAFTAGFSHTCHRPGPKGSNIECAGANEDGELGISNTANAASYKSISGTGNVSEGISLGDRHSCAVWDQTVRCTGSNDSDQIGQSSNLDKSSFTDVKDLAGVYRVVAGAFHTCAVLQNGILECWGDNSNGQLGVELNGNLSSISKPQEVFLDNHPVRSVAAWNHTCALTYDNLLYCWGDNSYLQCGLGGASGQAQTIYTPKQLSKTDFTHVAVGEKHSCAVDSNDKLYCWGGNEVGQVGTEAGDVVPAPEPVSSLGDVTNVVAGALHTCALLVDGRVMCWGDNSRGQLGDGKASEFRYLPAEVNFDVEP
jgi:alpha-tubulin suppressor-like RCC1 family protein